jgi:hypothetical protein
VLGPSLWANKGSQAKWRLKEDAGYYIIKVPKTEHEAPEWQAAMEGLDLGADTRRPTMFARIGIMRALNRHQVREFNPDRKPHHWGKRKLKRDLA